MNLRPQGCKKDVEIGQCFCGKIIFESAIGKIGCDSGITQRNGNEFNFVHNKQDWRLSVNERSYTDKMK